MSAELFNETPFNLAGELLDEGITAEGEARVRALAEAEARKAQTTLVFASTELERERDGRIRKARAYVARIKNFAKWAYANAYLRAKLAGEDTRDIPELCSYMAAQGVRLQLAEILGD